MIDYQGNPYGLAQLGPQRRRRRRAVPLNPDDINTWHEEDLQNRLKERLRLGGWWGFHIRKQGQRRDGRNIVPGIVETVPAQAGRGWPDWVCVPDPRYTMDASSRRWTIYIELKSVTGEVTSDQAWWLWMLTMVGQECVVGRPHHAVAKHGQYDDMYLRLVDGAITEAWRAATVKPEMSIQDIMAL